MLFGWDEMGEERKVLTVEKYRCLLEMDDVNFMLDYCYQLGTVM